MSLFNSVQSESVGFLGSLAFLFTALSQGRQKHAIPWATTDLEPCAATDPDLEEAAV